MHDTLEYTLSLLNKLKDKLPARHRLHISSSQSLSGLTEEVCFRIEDPRIPLLPYMPWTFKADLDRRHLVFSSPVFPIFRNGFPMGRHFECVEVDCEDRHLNCWFFYMKDTLEVRLARDVFLVTGVDINFITQEEWSEEQSKSWSNRIAR